ILKPARSTVTPGVAIVTAAALDRDAQPSPPWNCALVSPDWKPIVPPQLTVPWRPPGWKTTVVPPARMLVVALPLPSSTPLPLALAVSVIVVVTLTDGMMVTIEIFAVLCAGMLPRVAVTVPPTDAEAVHVRTIPSTVFGETAHFENWTPFGSGIV